MPALGNKTGISSFKVLGLGVVVGIAIVKSLGENLIPYGVLGPSGDFLFNVYCRFLLRIKFGSTGNQSNG
jgi:hypothetical protein